jgi:ABC-type nitrate/sulfonate/bicarbonate transport system permease component
MKRFWMDSILPFMLLVAIGVFWEAAVSIWHIPSYILPPPSRIILVIGERWNLLVTNSLVTLGEITAGFVVALIGGVALALAIHSSRIVERATLPLVIASQTIPVFAIAPLLILWFGYGMGSKVVMAAIIVFFPIVINTVDGLRAADPDTISLLKVLEATPRQIMLKVRIPQALPFVFSGLKIGVAVSVIGAVIGEWVGAREGLGYLMIHANAQLQVDLVFAAIFCLSVMGVTLYALIGLLERHVVHWRGA